jgi:hypothetical protein
VTPPEQWIAGAGGDRIVTGVRQDPYANANRIPVEEDKPLDQRGRYMTPELYGKSKELGIFYVSPRSRRRTIQPNGER